MCGQSAAFALGPPNTACSAPTKFIAATINPRRRKFGFCFGSPLCQPRNVLAPLRCRELLADLRVLDPQFSDSCARGEEIKGNSPSCSCGSPWEL